MKSKRQAGHKTLPLFLTEALVRQNIHAFGPCTQLVKSLFLMHKIGHKTQH